MLMLRGFPQKGVLNANMKHFRNIICLLAAGCLLRGIPVAAEGYGQGRERDALNRPAGALNFQAEYAQHGAFALSDDPNRIILTFDQGYENGFTPKILDTLKEKNATAIFFLTGDYAKKEPELVRRMIAEGHMLGNHGMTHAAIPTLNTQALGYRTVFWSAAYVDWKTDAQPEPAAALRELTDMAHGGAIYLLHSVSETNAEILGSLIDALREKGYTV